MKIIKRNAVIITVILFVCVAVYLNWSYNKEVDDVTEDVPYDADDVLEDSSQDQETGTELYYSPDSDDVTTTATGENDEYFAGVRLARQQARDEASATLETVASAENASQETIDQALNQMTKIATWVTQEAEMENLIMSKGFENCVVYMSEDGVSVTVSAGDGLTNAEVAQITDIITTETDFSADQLKVIEIK